MSDLYVSWSDYHKKIEQLALKIYLSGWDFNQIVCIAKGGLRVGDILSRIYNQPLAILASSSYNVAGKSERGNLVISHHLTMTTETLGDRILLVDHLVDSGITLDQITSWLKLNSNSTIQELRTAVIWYKACSLVTPDYYVDYLLDSPWIHQPFEKYELMNPEDLHEC